MYLFIRLQLIDTSGQPLSNVFLSVPRLTQLLVKETSTVIINMSITQGILNARNTEVLFSPLVLMCYYSILVCLFIHLNSLSRPHEKTIRDFHRENFIHKAIYCTCHFSSFLFFLWNLFLQCNCLAHSPGFSSTLKGNEDTVLCLTSLRTGL